jgi:hypothetical protein
MNAEQLANDCELPYWMDGSPHQKLVVAAAMLRAQHEAIKVLREALNDVLEWGTDEKYQRAGAACDKAKAALAATEAL